MARGQKCPNCGNLTFQEEDFARSCTRCGVTGWIGGEGPKRNSARGRQCGTCQKGTLKRVASHEDVVDVHHCYTCAATFVTTTGVQ